MDVAVLDPDAAADFLISRTGDPDRQAARDLAELLGRLPLALEQAAAYLQAIGETLAGYLALFRQRRAGLLARGEPTGYSKTVASTWALAFDRLRQTGPGAVGLLRLLAFCAPEAIPLRLLLRPLPGFAERISEEVVTVLTPLLEDRLEAGDAIGALRRYSLVIPATGGSVSVHRLVQAVTADQMPKLLATQWAQATAALIEAAIPSDTAAPGTWPACAALLPHAQAALADDSDGMARIAKYVGSSGCYDAARDLQRRVLDARARALGPEHRDTLTARHELAYWTGEAGNAAAARELLAGLLPVRERILGKDHPDTLTTRANLARLTGEAGDPAAARDQYTGLLPILARILGPEHQETLVARANLALWTAEAGDAAAARGQYAALLPIQEQALGPEHPHTLDTRAKLAGSSGTAGDADAARDQLAALLPIRERVLGPEHPDTLDTRGALVYWTGLAGDAPAALDLFAALLPIEERVQGPEHPHTLATRANLACYIGQTGDAAGARDRLAALLPIQERVQGPEHWATLDTRCDLARFTREAGDAAGARDQYAACCSSGSGCRVPSARTPLLPAATSPTGPRRRKMTPASGGLVPRVFTRSALAGG
jgi:Tetratricopeptide repeat